MNKFINKILKESKGINNDPFFQPKDIEKREEEQHKKNKRLYTTANVALKKLFSQNEFPKENQKIKFVVPQDTQDETDYDNYVIYGNWTIQLYKNEVINKFKVSIYCPNGIMDYPIFYGWENRVGYDYPDYIPQVIKYMVLKIYEKLTES